MMPMCLLHDFNDMILELDEVVLNCNKIMTIIILFKDLLVESVDDLSLDDVWIVLCILFSMH